MSKRGETKELRYRHGKLLCTANSKRRKEPCEQYAIPGGEVCRWHGGAAPQVQRKAAERLEATKERVLLEYCRLAGHDIRNLFTADGKFVEIHKLDEDTARAIAGLDFEDVWEWREVDGKQKRVNVGRVAKIRMVDKKGALDSIAKHLGMFKPEEVNVTHGGAVAVKVLFVKPRDANDAGN